MDFLSKYAPAKVDDVAGNDDARSAVKKWALNWSRGVKGKPLLVTGPVGCGKTALVTALAQEMSWELVSVPAGIESDKAKRLFSSSSSLFGSLRLIFFDEVDGFGKKEVSEVEALLEGFNAPVIFTANDAWAQNISALRSSCDKVELKGIGKYELKRVLGAIIAKEGLVVDLQALVDSAEGDLRAALIDLQSGVGFRERKDNVFEALRHLFKAKAFSEAMKAGDSVDVDFDLFSRWIEENIPMEFEKEEEVALAFDRLSRANVFSGRIMRRQNFALFKFVRALTLAGVSMSKKEVYRKFSKYQFPEVIRKLGNSRKARQVRKGLLAKLSASLHCSLTDAKNCLWLAALPGAGEFFALTEDEVDLASALGGSNGASASVAVKKTKAKKE